MNPPIAIFYHIRINGGNPPCSLDWTSAVMHEQVKLLQSSGLADAASEITIGCGGNTIAAIVCESMAPRKAQVMLLGDAQSELPTLALLRQWLPGHEDYCVCYFHAKGATHPQDPLPTAWRRCQDKHVIRNWRRCVSDLDSGADAVGCHWLTPQQYPTLVKSPFFGGNYWWARASFLQKLPEIPDYAQTREDFFIAENWIGMGPLPRIVDYHRAWPSLEGCSKQL